MAARIPEPAVLPKARGIAQRDTSVDGCGDQFQLDRRGVSGRPVLSRRSQGYQSDVTEHNWLAWVIVWHLFGSGSGSVVAGAW